MCAKFLDCLTGHMDSHGWLRWFLNVNGRDNNRPFQRGLGPWGIFWKMADIVGERIFSTCNDQYCSRFMRGSAANLASASCFIWVRKKKGFKSQYICSRRNKTKYYTFLEQLASCFPSCCRYMQQYFRRFPFSRCLLLSADLKQNLLQYLT